MVRKQRPSTAKARPQPKRALPGANAPPGQAAAQLEHPLPFTVVGIGASAGGLDALSQLLRPLPAENGMALVVIQHLDPTHQSMLSEILARTTQLPVVEAADHCEIRPDHVYVIPPGKNMVIGDGRLQLSPRTEQRGQHRPIDMFLRSLAEHQGFRAIGVILSGSSSDGTLGLEDVKAAGGITFAQDDTAQHITMPRSAIAAGCIDFVLAPEDIAHEIARIARHPCVAPDRDAMKADARSASLIGRVLDLLRHATGVDFANYKRNTLHRRITRRMLLHKFESLQDYVRFLQSTPVEIEALYQDILISVTSFFRDADAYEAIKRTVFPRLTENRSRNDQVRVWALGCSTGEEAYSVAMAYVEYAEAVGCRLPMQIFATDLNGAGIEKARAGFYPKGIAQDLSPERLRRFFVEVDGAYRIAKPIRDMCIFARQNVLADPPFSRMDMIACRNMLIYLEPVLQQKLLPVLHYSLNQVGYLWLGSSETIGSYRELFEIEDPKNKIYRRKAKAARGGVRIPQQISAQRPRPDHKLELPAGMPADPHREADRILLQRYAPAGIVVNADLEIQQFRGDTGTYLAPSPGRASLNLLKMLREGLLVGVRSAAQRAQREKATVREDGLRVKTDAGYRRVTVTVIPMSGGAQDSYLLITFEPQENLPTSAAAKKKSKAGRKVTALEERGNAEKGNAAEIARLRQELDSTREYMQALIEQQEAANEELQSANEEVQSSNEELQSINEELETSKEEIQSSNEELATVNDELQQRNLELTQSNNDLLNLFGSVQIAIVMLGRDLRIRRFTPPAEKMMKLIPSDVGRPIGDIKLAFSLPDLEPLLLDAIDSASVRERLVKDESGRWLALRVHPYKTLENQIDGALLVLVDIDQLTRAESALVESREKFSLLTDSSRSALRESEGRFVQLADNLPALTWVSDAQGRGYTSRTYLEFLGVDAAQARGDGWMRFIHPQDRDAYVASYRETVARREVFEGQCRLLRADGEYRWMKAVAVPRIVDGNLLGYVGCKIDITDIKQAEERLRELDRSKNTFLAILAHELRTPLAAMRNAVQVIGHKHCDASMTERSKAVLERQTQQMVRMVDDLLDLSRLSRGTFELRKHPMNLVEALRQAVDVTAHERQSNAQHIALEMPDDMPVDADAARLQQVFANLLSNAARYTPRGGHVRVSARIEPAGSGVRSARHATVRVRDDGIGIDAEHQAHIFDLFAQQGGTIGQGAGLGIGLNLAKRIVERHGGELTVHSEGKDQGSEFVVRLPLQHAAARCENGAPRSALPTLAEATPLRVLVVDDNGDAAQMLMELLELAGQQVRVANDGEAALRLAHEFKPHLVLLDISMPGMDGREVARRLREDAALNGLCVVAVTGFSPHDVPIDHEHGFDDRVTKPFENDALVGLIARVQKRLTH